MQHPPRLLILETSHQPGLVALAEGSTILGRVSLNESRRHARDLVPSVQSLLTEHNCKARDLAGVIVSIGPGSYTGLRVGLMSAKTLAYASGCVLLGIETFAAIAQQAPKEAHDLTVISDAQQGKLYAQRFARSSTGQDWQAVDRLTIAPFADWATTLTPETWITGPGLEIFLPRLPTSQLVAPRPIWVPAAESLLALGFNRFLAGERDDPFALEPLYLRPSSAEENWNARHGTGETNR